MNQTNEYQTFIDVMTRLSEVVSKLTDPPQKTIYSNQELSKFLEVSTRTLQNWRDRGMIGYSKVGKNIFYKLSDVLDMLNKYHQQPFA